MDFKNYIDSRIIFSVPIYFRSQREHQEYFDAKRQNYISNQERLHKQFSNEITLKDTIRWELSFESFYYHVWKYTEVIGYIEFRKKESSIFAFVHLPEAKRYSPKMYHKTFRLSGDFPDYEIELEDKTNESIAEEMQRIIEDIGKSNRRFQRYHIYIRELENYIHFIDYHNI